MKSIFNHAVSLYGGDENIEAVWGYLNRLISSGIIEEGTAEQIAYMIESEV